MEAIMAIVQFNTLCAAAVAATIITVLPALAGGGRDEGGESCKGCPSWRSDASSNAPPWWPTPPYSQDYISTLTGSRPPVVYHQAGEGEGVRARGRVTHVP